ncbi:MAG: hypothetical protein QOH93_2718, partial [Chloroflexia bacterium]|nr:hypothetical protein [Chloroflexia bacterium]
TAGNPGHDDANGVHCPTYADIAAIISLDL